MLGTNRHRYKRMALIRPSIDLNTGTLNVSFVGSSASIHIPLASPGPHDLQSASSRVCGDKINALTYSRPDIVDFFSEAIGTSCTLARFPPSLTSKRHFKPHLQVGSGKNGDAAFCTVKQPPILLSNESPMLLVNRTSIDHLNELIKGSGGKAAKADVFRANIVIYDIGRDRIPYAEDTWKYLQIGKEYIEVSSPSPGSTSLILCDLSDIYFFLDPQLLGPCRRCHMVCIDQQTAIKDEEPYVTLSKTRRIGGRVLFGQYATHVPVKNRTRPGIKAGDLVRVLEKEPRVETGD